MRFYDFGEFLVKLIILFHSERMKIRKLPYIRSVGSLSLRLRVFIEKPVRNTAVDEFGIHERTRADINEQIFFFGDFKIGSQIAIPHVAE